MRISVYITSYNQREYLVEAIESVLAQTLRPHEIIIVDDCSSDGSQEVIAGYASCYPDLLKPIYHTQNQGVSRTRIDALWAVTGDYVTFVDGDDRFLPTKLEKEAKVLRENPDAQIAFSNNYRMTADGVHISLWAEEERPPEGDVFCRIFARDFPKRSLFRSELVDYRAWQKVGFHDPNLNIYEDYDMRIRLTKHCRAVYCDEPLSEYRVCDTGLSRANFARHLEVLEYIYQKNRPLLYDIDDTKRKYVERMLSGWLAAIAIRAAEEALFDGYNVLANIKQAIGFYLKSAQYCRDGNGHGYRQLAKFVSPHRLYRLTLMVRGRFK